MDMKQNDDFNKLQNEYSKDTYINGAITKRT
jgi:hypothetical protein